MARKLLWASLALAPITFIVDFAFHPGDVALFLLAAATLIPLAWLIGESTEQASEHTGPGIGGFLEECRRITRRASFHNIPVARKGCDHGWTHSTQSFFNNSVSWWLPKFRRVFSRVDVIDSSWNNDESVGKWFVCIE